MKQYNAIAILDKNGRQRDAMAFACMKDIFIGGSFLTTEGEWIKMTGTETVKTHNGRISNARREEYIIQIEEE